MKTDLWSFSIVRRAIVPSIRERRLDVPIELEDIIMKSLARDREDRFDSAGELKLPFSFSYGQWPTFRRRAGSYARRLTRSTADIPDDEPQI